MRDNVQYSTLSPLQLHCNYSLCDISEHIAVRDCFFFTRPYKWSMENIFMKLPYS